MLMYLTAITGNVKKAWHFRSVLLHTLILNNVWAAECVAIIDM